MDFLPKGPVQIIKSKQARISECVKEDQCMDACIHGAMHVQHKHACRNACLRRQMIEIISEGPDVTRIRYRDAMGGVSSFCPPSFCSVG